MFKRNQRIVCIDNKNYARYLEIGKRYTVERLEVRPDLGETYVWLKETGQFNIKRFKSIKDYEGR